MSSMFSSQCRPIVSPSALSARRNLCDVKLASVRGLYSRGAVFTKRTTRKNQNLRMAMMLRNQKPPRTVGKILLPPHPRMIVLNQANRAPQPLQRKRRASLFMSGYGCLLCMSAGQREQEFLIDGLAPQDNRGPVNVVGARGATDTGSWPIKTCKYLSVVARVSKQLNHL
jgi:hypothetical protein